MTHCSGAAGAALTRVLAKKFFKLSAATKFAKFRNGLFGDLPAVKPRDPSISNPPPGGVTTIDHININQLQNDKVYIYVIDESNNLKVALRGSASSGIKHTQLINSGPAKGGGEFVVSGKSINLNRETGRYRAHSDQALGRVKALFNSQEFSVNFTGPL